MPKTVSIIIRGKNEEDWLGLCLKSIHEQTFKDFEVIYIDNESKDASLKIAKYYKVDKVLSISGNTFTWNDKSIYNGEEGTGIIAQEIEALGLPGVTETRQDGTKAVRYDRLVPLLIEAIKELDGKVKSLEG